MSEELCHNQHTRTRVLCGKPHNHTGLHESVDGPRTRMWDEAAGSAAGKSTFTSVNVIIPDSFRAVPRSGH